ncbi:methyltransferase domain-containing protein [Trichophaea hybrida]|nr:methyltransferase domain-containing protein [Trichophaea hybrida]
MLPTPDTSHIDPLTTYEPSSDSFLILDTLTSDAAFLAARFPLTSPTPVVLELGTGSGIITAFIASHSLPLFNRSDLLLLGTDANSLACNATNKTVSLTPQPHLFLGALTADLFSPIRAHAVDVLVFNPPYVPTPEVPELLKQEGETPWEEESRLLALAYAGGEDGMEVTRRVFQSLEEVLSSRGVAYVLLCGSNKPTEVVAGLEKEGWRCDKVGESGRRGGIEKLDVWRIWR